MKRKRNTWPYVSQSCAKTWWQTTVPSEELNREPCLGSQPSLLHLVLQYSLWILGHPNSNENWYHVKRCQLFFQYESDSGPEWGVVEWWTSAHYQVFSMLFYLSLFTAHFLEICIIYTLACAFHSIWQSCLLILVLTLPGNNYKSAKWLWDTASWS